MRGLPWHPDPKAHTRQGDAHLPSLSSQGRAIARDCREAELCPLPAVNGTQQSEAVAFVGSVASVIWSFPPFPSKSNDWGAPRQSPGDWGACLADGGRGPRGGRGVRGGVSVSAHYACLSWSSGQEPATSGCTVPRGRHTGCLPSGSCGYT